MAISKVSNIDLSAEISQWLAAELGEEVRSANVSAFEKIQTSVNGTVQNVNSSAEAVNKVSENAQQYLDNASDAKQVAEEMANIATTKASESRTAADDANTYRKAAEAAAKQTVPLGYVDRGEYKSTETYFKKDVVYYDGSTWISLNNMMGITPHSGTDWKLLARGATSFEGLTVTDTYGLSGTSGASVSAQKMIDLIADQIVNKIYEKLNTKANTSVKSSVSTISTLNLLDNGVYLIQTTTVLAGLPAGWYQIVVAGNGSNTTVMVATDLNAHTFIRRRVGGTWTSWSRQCGYLFYQDFNYSIRDSDWVISAKGQRYYNMPTSISGGIAVSCSILNWSGTAHHISVSYYENDHIQFRSEYGGVASGTVRVFYMI